MTSVSVIIPCHNAREWIEPAISSALRQTLPPLEVLVIDDASTDGSAEVAGAVEGPVRVLQTDFRNGATARAEGAEQARGDALLFLDADDLLGPHAIEGLATILTRGGIARCDWRRYEDAGDGAWIARPASCPPLAPWQDELAGWLTGWYCPPSAVLWSREALEISGGWRRGRSCNQDGDVVMRALARGVPMQRAPFGEAFYRRQPGPTVSDRRLTEEGLQTRLDILDELGSILREQGTYNRYTSNLAEAYELIRHDAEAEGHGGLAERAARLARRRSAAAGMRSAGGRLALRRDKTPVHGAKRTMKGTRPYGADTLVSVVIPTFERPEATLRAVESVLDQTHAQLDVIVVDDASTDDTADRVAQLADARLRVLRQARNGGVARARNRGMAEARGELIAFLDSDDAWLPEKTERCIAALAEAGPLAGMVTCGVRNIRAAGEETVFEPQVSDWPFADLIERNVLHGGSNALMITREAYDTVGGFDPSLPAIEDWDYLIRLSRFFSVTTVPQPLVLYSETDEPGRRSRQFRANLDARQMLFLRYRDELRRTGRAHRFLMESARRELTEAGGSARAGRRLVLGALAEQPFNARLYQWLPYMMLPGAWRALVRRIDNRTEPRPV